VAAFTARRSDEAGKMEKELRKMDIESVPQFCRCEFIRRRDVKRALKQLGANKFAPTEFHVNSPIAGQSHSPFVLGLFPFSAIFPRPHE
jgi:hypothetical protein